MALSADENAALIAKLGWFDNPPSGARPPAVAAPFTPPPDPLAAGMAKVAGEAPPPPLPPAPSPPPLPANAHVPGNYATALAPDQTVHVSGPVAAPPQGAPPSGGYQFPMAPGGGGTASGSTSTTVQKGVPISDETRGLIRTGENHQQQGLAEEGVGQERLSQAKAEGARRESEVLGDQAKATRELNSESDSELGRKRQHIENMIADVNSQKVDPGRWWKNANTGTKISAALSMIAGGFAAGWNHSDKNAGAEMVNRLVADDIHAQEENMASARAGVQQQGQLYEMAKGGFHDRREQMAAAHVVGLAQVRKELDAKIEEASDPIEKGRLLQARGGLELKQGEAHLRLDEMGADKVSKTNHVAFASPGAGGTASRRKEFDALTEKLVVEKNLSVDAAHNLAAQMMQLPGAPGGNGSIPGGGKKDPEQERILANAQKSLTAIGRADISQITAGSTLGEWKANHVPGWLPTVDTAKANQLNREKYNNEVKIAVGGGYKAGTDATEPKRLELIEAFAHPFEVQPGDSPEVAQQRRSALQAFIKDNAGIDYSSLAASTPYSYLKPSGGQ